MSEWISVSDRLPEIGVEVLVYRPDAHLSQDPEIRTSFFHGIEYAPKLFACLVQPTHWMPLPKAPTK